MKKLLLAIVVILFTSCTTEPIENETQLQRPALVTQLVAPEHELYNPYEVAQPNIVLCGTITGCSTNFTYPASVFVGVYYYIQLDTPYFDGTTTWTKAIIVKNDALNTPLLQQYWYNPLPNICDNITYFYN